MKAMVLLTSDKKVDGVFLANNDQVDAKKIETLQAKAESVGMRLVVLETDSLSDLDEYLTTADDLYGG